MNESVQDFDNTEKPFSLFVGSGLIASGRAEEVVLPYKRALAAGSKHVLVFDNSTGRSIDFDVRGDDDEVVAKARRQFGANTLDNEPPSRGRPKLGVIAREVTLLPRHWDWLATQRGGASVTLRRLVDEARKAGGEKERQRLAQERAYHFMSAIAGDFANFEEASRALFRSDEEGLRELTESWPEDIRRHLVRLAGPREAV